MDRRVALYCIDDYHPSNYVTQPKHKTDQTGCHGDGQQQLFLFIVIECRMNSVRFRPACSSLSFSRKRRENIIYQTWLVLCNNDVRKLVRRPSRTGREKLVPARPRWFVLLWYFNMQQQGRQEESVLTWAGWFSCVATTTRLCTRGLIVCFIDPWAGDDA